MGSLFHTSYLFDSWSLTVTRCVVTFIVVSKRSVSSSTTQWCVSLSPKCVVHVMTWSLRISSLNLRETNRSMWRWRRSAQQQQRWRSVRDINWLTKTHSGGESGSHQGPPSVSTKVRASSSWGSRLRSDRKCPLPVSGPRQRGQWNRPSVRRHSEHRCEKGYDDSWHPISLERGETTFQV